MKKNEIILVCTPIKQLIPNTVESTLIFPANLVSNSISPLLKNYNFKEGKFRWSNISNMEKDYDYINNFYEKSLSILSKNLNEYHNKQYTENYWRILIGPWLASFYFILFERYYALKNCFDEFEIDKINMLNFKNMKEFIPNEMFDYVRFQQDDLWNQSIYQELIQVFFSKEKKISLTDYNETWNIKNKSDKNIISNFIKFFFNKVPINKFYNYLVTATYMGMVNELKLSMKLGQFPIFYKRQKLPQLIKVDESARKKISKNNFTKGDIQDIFFQIVSNKIPKYFLEGFTNLVQKTKKLNYPKDPKIIFSSNLLWADSLTMCYLAEKIEKGTKLIYGQHGGVYGLNKINFHEKHELKVSNEYITWGWKSEKKKTQNFGILLNSKKLSKNQNPKKLLILMRAVYKYFYTMQSGMGIERSEDYLNYCKNFYNNLSDQIKKDTIIRLHTNNFEKEIIKNFNLNKKSQISQSSFHDDCNNAKLIVNTCNSTPLLQVLSKNFPSIIIWKSSNNPIREEAKKFIDSLFEGNILFYDHFKAAEFINKIWTSDINNWWWNKETQYTVKKFNEVFSKNNDDLVLNLKQLIKGN